jgi:hypothetical protein
MMEAHLFEFLCVGLFFREVYAVEYEITFVLFV